MKYGILDYESLYGFFNLGDYVQSLAAAQYLPQIDKYLNREELNNYQGEKTKIILNGWFMNKPHNWPPSKDIEPLFISFHINKYYEEKMLSQKSISYMKNIGSVGCRDYHTAEILESHGINSYYSSCLTTTLKPFTDLADNERKGVYLVDVLHGVPNLGDYSKMPLKYILSHLKNGNIRKSISQKTYLKEIENRLPNSEIETITNKINGKDLSIEERIILAQKYLRKLATAKLVITSRIHCALPCLAFNTPVIFIKHGQTSKTNMYRFRGIVDHFNVIDLDNDLLKNGFHSNIVDFDAIDYNNPLQNPKSFRRHIDHLINTCESFISSP